MGWDGKAGVRSSQRPPAKGPPAAQAILRKPNARMALAIEDFFMRADYPGPARREIRNKLKSAEPVSQPTCPLFARSYIFWRDERCLRVVGSAQRAGLPENFQASGPAEGRSPFRRRARARFELRSAGAGLLRSGERRRAA